MNAPSRVVGASRADVEVGEDLNKGSARVEGSIVLCTYSRPRNIVRTGTNLTEIGNTYQIVNGQLLYTVKVRAAAPVASATVAAAAATKPFMANLMCDKRTRRREEGRSPLTRCVPYGRLLYRAQAALGADQVRAFALDPAVWYRTRHANLFQWPQPLQTHDIPACCPERPKAHHGRYPQGCS